MLGLRVVALASLALPAAAFTASAGGRAAIISQLPSVVQRHAVSPVAVEAEDEAVAAPAPAPAPATFVPGESCTGEKVVVVGASGYIGKAVVREAVRRGYDTTAVVRDPSRSEPKFAGARVVRADVCQPATLEGEGAALGKGAVDVVISCLASRSGSKKDSFAIDYQATLNCFEAARKAGARHFVMLSAFCALTA